MLQLDKQRQLDAWLARLYAKPTTGVTDGADSSTHASCSHPVIPLALPFQRPYPLLRALLQLLLLYFLPRPPLLRHLKLAIKGGRLQQQQCQVITSRSCASWICKLCNWCPLNGSGSTARGKQVPHISTHLPARIAAEHALNFTRCHQQC